MEQAKSLNKYYLYTFLIVLAGLFFRRPDAFTNPQIYAEDGPVFLQQYYELGFKSIFTSYAGYFHTIPRLIAFIFGTLRVPLSYIPLCYNLSYAALCLGLASALLRSAATMQIRHKIIYAIIFMFIPVGPEMFMNITNSIWITSLYLVNFLFIGYKNYDAEKGKGIKLLAIFLISLTGPFSLLLSPIVVLIIALENKKLSNRQLIPLLVILLGGFVQLVSIKLHPSNRAIPGTPEHFHLLKLVKYNIRDLIFGRNCILPDLSERTMTVLCLVIFLTMAFFLVRAFLKIGEKRKYVLILAPAVYLASFIAVFWPMEPNVLAFGCPRYYFVPYTCFAWILLIGFNDIIRLRDIAIYFIYFLLHGKNMRYTLADKQWKAQVTEYNESKRSTIDINPDGWRIVLPAKGSK